MSRKTKLLGTLSVSSAMILSYVAQVSHVPAEVVAKWSQHEWVGAALLVILSGLSTWKIFLTDPKADADKPNVQRPALNIQSHESKNL